MIDREKRMLHVSEEEYFAAAQLLNSEIHDQDNNVEAVLSGHVRHCSERFGRMLQGIAEAIVAIDRSDEKADDYTRKVTRRGVLTGGVAAVAVARLAYVPEQITVTNIFDAIEIDDVRSMDPHEEAHDLAVILRDFGWQGMRTAGDRTEDLFSDWEVKLIPDIRYQNTFRIGGGVVFESLKMLYDPIFAERKEAHEKADREKFEKEAAGDIDWEVEIANLFG